MIKSKNTLVGHISTKRDLSGKLSNAIVNVYPDLEDLEVTPTSVEQNFKSSKYGYDNVKVKAVASDDLEITPTLESQEYVGLYGKVNVNPATEVYDEAYENGKNSVIDFARYAYSFQFGTTEGLPEEFTINLDNAKNISAFWSGVINTTVKHITVNVLNKMSGADKISRCFNQVNVNNNNKALEHITFNVDTSAITNFPQVFYMNSKLKIIDGKPIDFSSATSITWNWCSGCSVLEEVRVVKESIKVNIPVDIKNASDETIQSFVDGLADLTGQEAKTVTWHTNLILRLTEEQIQTMENKNWEVR